ncbi:hypothetical protein NPIL_405671 [Nephila pilipes]|uniref:Uncharacterized protein n=1 Tax=Nephila pilipes TaxID=299642 RepID=A0A8X6PCH0_NEPPI|nr:hypothetical protein NPIL_405671 [Nephila pilipes]
MVQKEAFLSKKDAKLKTLETIRDEEGIIRLKTKIIKRKDYEDFLYTAVLPDQQEVPVFQAGETILFIGHSINTGNSTLILGPPFQKNPAKKEMLKKEMNSILVQVITEVFESTYSCLSNCFDFKTER